MIYGRRIVHYYHVSTCSHITSRGHVQRSSSKGIRTGCVHQQLSDVEFSSTSLFLYVALKSFFSQSAIQKHIRWTLRLSAPKQHYYNMVTIATALISITLIFVANSILGSNTIIVLFYCSITMVICNLCIKKQQKVYRRF